ncbi:MAG: HAMP domain-containing sensor histidine kinase [Kineosporiaceae bacterium]
MRARIRLLTAATTSAVVIAFLVPLLLLVGRLAADRALSAAMQEAQRTAVVAATVTDTDEVGDVVADLGSAHAVSVLLPGGDVLGVPLDAIPPGAADRQLERARQGTAFTARVAGGAAAYVPTLTDAGTAVVRSYVTDAELHRGVRRASITVVGLGVVLLLLALLVADRLAASATRPFHRLATAAEQMRAGDLDLRVPEEGVAEATALAGALNRLAARVQELLAAERDTVADLSHRLRTPITALRLDVEHLAARPGVRGEAEELVLRLREHVDTLQRSVDAVVRDARRATRSSVGVSCDAVEVVRDRVAFWSVLAEDTGRTLALRVPPHPVRAGIEAGELADVLDALIDNVFAHTPDGVALAVGVAAAAGGGAAVTVEDAGPGLPGVDVAERGRSGAGSTGLGLDIAARAAAASGGGLELGTAALGGAQVTVLLGPPRD